MQNAKSTIAMRLAHKIAKQYPKATFKACLAMAWKVVRIDITVAQRILFGRYKVKMYKTANGAIDVLEVIKKGFKAAVKRAILAQSDYIFSRYAW